MIGVIGRAVAAVSRSAGKAAGSTMKAGGSGIESGGVFLKSAETSMPNLLKQEVIPKPTPTILKGMDAIEDVGRSNPRGGLTNLRDFMNHINETADLPVDGAKAPEIENPSSTSKPETEGDVEGETPTEEKTKTIVVERQKGTKTEPPQQPHEKFNIISKTIEETPGAIGADPKDIHREDP